MDAAGTWHGEYRYDPEDAGSPVTFTLRLTQDALGRVSGTVTEGPGGMPEEGRIVGDCRRDRLQFLKLMPVARVGAAEGTEVTEQVSVFLARLGLEAEGPVEHPELLYEGRLAPDGRSVTGTWRLDDYVVPLKGGQTFELPGSRGTWSATRSDA